LSENEVEQPAISSIIRKLESFYELSTNSKKNRITKTGIMFRGATLVINFPP
jgi:hypothetical protein